MQETATNNLCTTVLTHSRNKVCYLLHKLKINHRSIVKGCRTYNETPRNLVPDVDAIPRTVQQTSSTGVRRRTKSDQISTRYELQNKHALEYAYRGCIPIY